MKSFDIIIPTYRPQKSFEKLLYMLGRQQLPAGRLILVNTERQLWEAAEFDHRILETGRLENGTAVELYHIRSDEFDHGGTRAWAAGHSDADVLMFMTQDAMPQDEFLTQHLINAFSKDTSGMIAAAYARQEPTEDCSYLEAYTRSFNYGNQSFVKSREDLPELGIKTFFCSNVCAAYLREAYELLGGFEKHTIFNEDMILTARLVQRGYRVAYVAEARVIHSHNYNGRQQFQRNFDLAVSQTEHPEIFAQVRSESEGIRLVKRSAAYLIRQHKTGMLAELFWQSACKYLGYRMGKRWKRLPRAVVLRCTMSPHAGFWKNKFF
ncbi:MAG: glycosyltransferase family 2 protein [Eubacteriales bacterium]|nr:glycosyltransferase family 2 protein [Eubacteriales bacterium]